MVSSPVPRVRVAGAEVTMRAADKTSIMFCSHNVRVRHLKQEANLADNARVTSG